MKELIYRRASAGYAVVRCDSGISEAVRAKATNQSGVAADATNDICYRQFRLTDEIAVLGANYLDSAGSRMSAMSQLLITSDASETQALFSGYPARADFFADFRDRYNAAGRLEDMPDETEVSVERFLGGGGPAEAFAVLRETFGNRELLAAVFEALLDVASNNPKMLLLFGQNEPLGAMAKRGKRIIESLFACLPPVLALHIGYICPTWSDAGNALLGVRYSAKRLVSNDMRSFAYVCDLEARTLGVPGRPSHSAAAYAAELAELAFRGGASAVERLHKLNVALNDPELFDATDVPGGVSLRYRFVNGVEQIPESDQRAWLDWHHAAAIAGDKKEGSLLRSKFWETVDTWVTGGLLDAIYARRDGWRDGDPVYSRARVAEIYADGQRLFALGRPEAATYRERFSGRLMQDALLDPASQPNVERELVRSFVEQVRRSEDGNFAGRGLYWADIEQWIRTRWCDGRLIRERSVLEAVQRLYAIDASAGEPYVQPFADYCKRNYVNLLTLVQTEFGRAVYDRIRIQSPQVVTERATKELTAQDPFGDSEGLNKFQQYRRLLEGDEQFRPTYVRMCDESLKRALNRRQAQDVEALFRELDAPKGGIVDVFGRMSPVGDASASIVQRLTDLLKADGVYPYYPAKPELAHKVADLLDRGQGQQAWNRRLSVLESVKALPLSELGEEEFDRLMEEGFGADGDAGLGNHVRALLWSGIQESFKDGGNMKCLLMALALYNSRTGTFRPLGILADAEKLELSEKKLCAFCRHRKEPTARRGLGYVARAVNEASARRQDGDQRDRWLDYPGERVELTSTGMFSGIPMPVAIASIFVFGAGLAASIVGLLMTIGLI